MRFQNESDIEIDRRLLRRLAEPFGLMAPLPGAIQDDIGLYVGRYLRVRLRPTRRRRPSIPSGWYSCGAISIFPCPDCTPGFVVSVFLHELFHAWLSQHDDGIYLRWNHCSVADRFSDRAFELLGGRWRIKKCGSFRLPRTIPARRHVLYDRYVGTLVSRQGAAIRQWNPNSESRRLTGR